MLDVLAKTTNSRDTHRLIREGALDGQQELDLLRDIARENRLAEETMDYLARTDVQEVIAAHAGTPGRVLHRIVTDFNTARGQDDWESQMVIGMHRNALPDTLTLLADEALNPPREWADQPDEWTAACIGGLGYREGGYGPFETLVAVMVNAFTPEPTAEKLQARFRAAVQLAEQAEPGSLEHVLGDIHTLFSYHQGLDYRRMPSIVKWMEDAVKAAQSTAHTG